VLLPYFSPYEAQRYIKISYNWIERAKNKEADRLSNIAMDKNII